MFTDFTPVRGILGGALIGTGAAVLLLFNGDIFGCSGITASALFQQRPSTTTQQHWKLVFLTCFFVTSSLLPISVVQDDRLMSDESVPIPSMAAYLLGGFLVGFGTLLGSGCTTGHGICGLARFSRRSIVSVATFMGSAMVTAILTSPTTNLAIFGFLRAADDQHPMFEQRRQIKWIGWILTAILVLWSVRALLVSLRRQPRPEEQRLATTASEASSSLTTPNGGGVEQASSPSSTDNTVVALDKSKLLPAGASGVLFAVGLAFSEMVWQSKNFAFLDISKIPSGLWDPTLACVMGGAVVVSWISYQYVPGYSSIFNNNKTLECPLAVKDGAFNIPTRTEIDKKLIGGAVCFGVGWGIVGLCPGPGLFLAASGIQSVVYFYCPAYAVGVVLAERLKEQ